MELQNNTILITGGTSGFGYEFAARLLALGNTVIITGRNQARLDETRNSLPGVHTFQSDVSDPSAIASLYEQITHKFPDLNVLINNAGEMRKINLNDPSIDLLNITREIDINLIGPIRMVQQFLPHLKKQKSAAILNVTSGIALIPFPISPIYGATKSGLRSYTQSLRVQLKNTSVKVFELIAPGAKTPLNDTFSDVDGFNDSMLMEPEKLVDKAIKGLQNDTHEIYPGLACVMKIISRVAPSLALSQTSKVGARSMAQ
ncbi:SDR family NAD(P)-dependent oxidoreductase [Spirosoma sp. BT702]|uniref:SDR family NAD(P)-dependent oxidoreductase n=1 Tax=Spirosoma profusum TaxID=2771354 RepID=A0A927AQP7_9BACT|nr:SDR family NAD(P)-dependent oxidoreductase [Spirosoma profusum]MBD2700901.1 SDR family NAD(P)-dependent oxidoreductase [Spirosoma profusum]